MNRTALRGLVFAELAALDAGRVILVDDRQSARQRLIADLDQRDGNAGIGKTHGDATAHRAAADNADGIDRALRRIFGQDRRFSPPAVRQKTGAAAPQTAGFACTP